MTVSPIPVAPHSKEAQRQAYVKPTGFREYDARWQFPEEINLLGIQAVGRGLATQLKEQSGQARIVVGNDYRSYSQSVKDALIVGLLAAGAEVHDIGTCLTPVAYFARKHLGVDGLAMVTASHNENGWTGIKMGSTPPLTFGPEEMTALKERVLSSEFEEGQGQYVVHEDVHEAYIQDAASAGQLNKKLKVVVACGNGTAALYAPDALRAIGCDVVEMDCELDWTFPNYNPNPEDMEFLEAMRERVLAEGADLGLGFDGDGDRVGVVDETGHETFSDKIGLLIARNLAKQHPGSKFVVDIKSTGLYQHDEVLKETGSEAEYWITGHSYLKHRIHETGALAGFEKSGHFFFASPLGNGYDDAIVSAIQVCRMVDDAGEPLSALIAQLPQTWQTPTMAPKVTDETKYDIVAQVTKHFEGMREAGEQIAGKSITDTITVNGVRVVLEDGTWGLVRASSNKPSLVVVAESPVSEEQMKEMFRVIDGVLQEIGVGEYDQKIAI